ncbi:MAG TPA: hypothetical protein VKQ32_11720 [Polyangia bacterium]|nr:hypothetical protein [Polyangia bacterium]
MPRFPRISTAVALVALAFAGCDKGDDKGTKAQAFCHDVIQEGCVRAWDCVPPGEQSADFTAHYGTSLDQCLSLPDNCDKYPASCPGFDAAAGATCLSEFTTQACGQLLILDANGNPTIALPTSCGSVCK